jgi:serine/threonine protein kinase
MPKHSVIGEGTYGCVHRPSLKCKDRDIIVDPSIVSKILTKKDAVAELNEFKLMEKADTKTDFYLGKPDICNPDDTESNKTAITKCEKGDFNPSNMSAYSLLLLKYGGLDLDLYGKHMSNMKLTHITRRDMEHFWMDMSRIIYGLNVLGNNDIVHHDMKHKNTVYDADSGRVSFIDFGLMTTKTKIMNASVKNEYELGIKHWSFPMELELLNQHKYRRTISDQREMNRYFESILKSFQRENRYVFNCIFENERVIKRELKPHFMQFSQMVKELTPNNYLDFLNKSIDTIDSYGTGTGLLSVLYQTKRLIDDALFTDLKDLFMNMVHPNVFLRKSVKQLVMEYERIMETHGLLQKYNLKFKKHMLVDNLRTKSSIVNKIDKIKGTGVYMSPKDRESFLKSIVIQCPIGKEVNPATKRCINVCKPGFERNEQFLCRKKKTQKKTQTTKSAKKCPEGAELNPITKRCNKTCKRGYKRNSDFICVKDK